MGLITKKLLTSTGYAIALLFAALASGAPRNVITPLYYEYLIRSYGSCYFQDNGDGTTTASVTINYLKAEGKLAGGGFGGRGILVYVYTKNGYPWLSHTTGATVTLNGAPHALTTSGWDFFMFVERSWAYESPWYNNGAFSANVQVTVPNATIADWPAVAIRAGNYTGYYSIAERSGAVYISDSGGNGKCRTISSPVNPPPLDINITVTAPDWNLGELGPSTADKTLSRTDEQLCFSYNSIAAQGQKFIINATSANGVVNNRYRLMHTSDGAQVVPYSLTLDNGGTLLQLPNNNSTALSLNTGGSTCFVPTFKTDVRKTVKAGDYSDTLTFTVTTKT